MKKLFVLALHLIGFYFNSFTQITDLEKPTNEFFNKYVRSGLVDYTSLVKNSTDLDQLIQLYGMKEFATEVDQDLKAFYINAYNLFVIEGLVKANPAQSPQEIPGFFTAKNHKLLGQKISLNQLENQKLKPKEDPRLHFVLVCGAKGCPPIANFAYHSKSLDSLINAQTTVALNDYNFVRYSSNQNELLLSQIFKWYSTDFLSLSGSELEYINQFRIEKIPSNTKVSYYQYDWTINSIHTAISDLAIAPEAEKSNLQLYTPSALFSWGQYEVNGFNSVYYQNSVRDKNGEEVALTQSQAFFNSLMQFTAGLPNSKRINVGVDLNITAARYGDAEDDPTDFFNDENTTYRKTIISSFGPRIKFVPFEKISRLSIQSTFLFPIAKDQESPFFIAHDRYTWFTQLFFDQSIGDHFQVFLEADLLYRFNRNSTNKNDFFRTPLSAFLSYFPTTNSTIYIFSQYSPRYENVMLSDGDEYGLSQWFLQVGIGAKYQITPKLGIEASFADFVDSANDGAGYSVNLGVRYIHR